MRCNPTSKTGIFALDVAKQAAVLLSSEVRSVKYLLPDGLKKKLTTETIRKYLKYFGDYRIATVDRDIYVTLRKA